MNEIRINGKFAAAMPKQIDSELAALFHSPAGHQIHAAYIATADQIEAQAEDGRRATLDRAPHPSAEIQVRAWLQSEDSNPDTDITHDPADIYTRRRQAATANQEPEPADSVDDVYARRRKAINSEANETQ